ncbi:hypothetical protein EDD18DRAFT_1105043 [Armillaria luteobubalina]|uniref:Uncharacterized protein n=1 Tax=Armillaria luteobubalina TaxID=153913 RepID=A0AA39Q5K9_9AGAR|nr:hypothetical protein EDD18DRAFT_1105043 [Armillaria luteobubalina]
MAEKSFFEELWKKPCQEYSAVHDTRLHTSKDGDLPIYLPTLIQASRGHGNDDDGSTGYEAGGGEGYGDDDDDDDDVRRDTRLDDPEASRGHGWDTRSGELTRLDDREDRATGTTTTARRDTKLGGSDLIDLGAKNNVAALFSTERRLLGVVSWATTGTVATFKTRASLHLAPYRVVGINGATDSLVVHDPFMDAAIELPIGFVVQLYVWRLAVGNSTDMCSIGRSPDFLAVGTRYDLIHQVFYVLVRMLGINTTEPHSTRRACRTLLRAAPPPDPVRTPPCPPHPPFPPATGMPRERPRPWASPPAPPQPSSRSESFPCPLPSVSLPTGMPRKRPRPWASPPAPPQSSSRSGSSPYPPPSVSALHPPPGMPRKFKRLALHAIADAGHTNVEIGEVFKRWEAQGEGVGEAAYMDL